MRQFIDSFRRKYASEVGCCVYGRRMYLLLAMTFGGHRICEFFRLFTRIVTNAWWQKGKRREAFLNELKSRALTKSHQLRRLSCGIYTPRECAQPLEPCAKQWALNLALRSAEITNSSNHVARHTVQVPLMKTFHSCISLDDNPSLPARQPASSRIQASRQLGARNLSLNQNARPQTRLLASHCSDCGQDFVISPNRHLAPCCGNKMQRELLAFRSWQNQSDG